MNVQTIESQVWWVASHDEIRPLKVPPAGAFVDALKNAFLFQIVPTETKLGQGVEFQKGVLFGGEGPIAINKFVAYNDGLNIAVPSNTDDADRVLEAALQTYYSLGVRQPITPPSHTYVSFIVADLDCSIDNFFPPSLFAQFAGMAPDNGAAHILGFGVQFDPMQIPRRPLGAGQNPGFRIERREGMPYDANRYYSVANLSTRQHLTLLEHFEGAARRAAG